MGQHRNYVSKKMLHKATGEHFNRKGHKIADMYIVKMQWYSLLERSSGSDRGSPSTGASTGIGADNQPILATCNLF